jgi:hypothetical protein
MLTQEYLKSIVDYDQETGVFTWRVKRSNIPAGTVIGRGCKAWYGQAGIDGKLYLLHRLAWLYIHGRWPADDIDHINGDRHDNRIANLREATRAQNLLNKGPRASNTSGYKGVTWSKRRQKWMAQIGHGGRNFGLGYYQTAEEAHAAYVAAAAKLHGEFARVA